MVLDCGHTPEEHDAMDLADLDQTRAHVMERLGRSADTHPAEHAALLPVLADLLLTNYDDVPDDDHWEMRVQGWSPSAKVILLTHAGITASRAGITFDAMVTRYRGTGYESLGYLMAWMPGPVGETSLMADMVARVGGSMNDTDCVAVLYVWWKAMDLLGVRSEAVRALIPMSTVDAP